MLAGTPGVQASRVRFHVVGPRPHASGNRLEAVKWWRLGCCNGDAVFGGIHIGVGSGGTVMCGLTSRQQRETDITRGE